LDARNTIELSPETQIFGHAERRFYRIQMPRIEHNIRDGLVLARPIQIDLAISYLQQPSKLAQKA